MATALDMTLDDLIKKNKKPSAPRRRPSGPEGGAGGSGPTRRAPNRARNRPNPYSVAPKAPESSWKHDMYDDNARSVAIETGTKLNITNLDYGVSDEDIKELFAEVGDIKRYSVNYDRSGRSLGTAVVVFARRADALEAIKRYHNVQLDGKPMKIELVGRNVERPVVAPVVPNAVPKIPNGNRNRGSERGNAGRRDGIAIGGGRGQRAGAGGRKRGGGGNKGGNPKVSAEDLDADLDKYHAGAMDTS